MGRKGEKDMLVVYLNQTVIGQHQSLACMISLDIHGRN